MAKKKISFSVDEADYQKILDYAKAKGHGGQFPTSIFAHYAVFQYMKKYPLSEAEQREIERRHGTLPIEVQRLYSLTCL